MLPVGLAEAGQAAGSVAAPLEDFCQLTYLQETPAVWNRDFVLTRRQEGRLWGSIEHAV